MKVSDLRKYNYSDIIGRKARIKCLYIHQCIPSKIRYHLYTGKRYTRVLMYSNYRLRNQSQCFNCLILNPSDKYILK